MFASEKGTKPWGASFGIPGLDATYDFVVIGGGTAGNTIAARLAEDASVSVAVVEAGGFYEVENGLGSVIPAMATTQFTGSDPDDCQPLIDWNFLTLPQQGVNNRVMRYARGKTLGGSSARHYNVYHRGTVGMYQRWAEIAGDDSYRFEHVLKYFKKNVTLTEPDLDARRVSGATDVDVQWDRAAFNPNHLGGPLQVTWANWAPKAAEWFMGALESIGIRKNPINFSSGVLSGYCWCPGTVNPHNMQRSSSKTSFLDQAMRNTSIKVYTRTHARRVLFDDSKRATSVLVSTDGRPFTLHARKEVLLCAGAFQSPQLLMVSGIGPAATLTEKNISVLSDLPGVGQNWQDHPAIAINYRFKDQTNSRLVYDPQYAAEKMQEYISHRTGPFTSIPPIVAFEKLPPEQRHMLSLSTQEHLRTYPEDWPEVEYVVGDGFKGLGRNYRTGAPKDSHNYISMTAMLVAPLSRGTMTISTNDALDPPVLDPNYLTHPADIEVALLAFKRLRKLGHWLEDNGATVGAEYFPGRDTVNTDEEILDFIRESLQTVYHASCTCAMGKSGDPAAVVDNEAKVFGVHGLRVVDASIFPCAQPGHPQASVYMIAEKIADVIKQAWKLS